MTLQAREAVLTVLVQAQAPLHWTKVQDLALREGHLDPFEMPDVRRAVLGALRELVAEGLVRKVGTGVYEAVR